MPLANIRSKVTLDYGGTWVRFALLNHHNKFRKLHSVPINKLPNLIEKVLKGWNVNFLSELVIGAKGLWKSEKKRALHSKLKKFAKKVTVLSDVEFTYNSVFGNKAGILLIAGTGSIAYGRDGKGNFARAGGLGPQKGDEGSGYWIGKEYLKRTEKREEWGRLPIGNRPHSSVRKTASLAKIVLQKAEQGDPIASQIVKEAHQHLNGLVADVSKKLHLKQFPLHLHGGLFLNRNFKRDLL